MERDQHDDPRDDELEVERERHAARYRGWGCPEFDDLRSPENGNIEDSVPERDREPEDLPKALEERAYKDAALLSKIRGLEPEVWARASWEQRLETLREAERQLASFQGRVAFRTYAVQLPKFVEGRAGAITPEPVHSGSPSAWNGHAEGCYIQISKPLLLCDDPETVVVVFAHESFHAYQTSVLWASRQGEAAPELLKRYPEVDATTLAGWHKWDGRTKERGEENLFELHAERYGCIVAERLYPGFWASGW